MASWQSTNTGLPVKVQNSGRKWLVCRAALPELQCVALAADIRSKRLLGSDWLIYNVDIIARNTVMIAIIINLGSRDPFISAI